MLTGEAQDGGGYRLLDPGQDHPTLGAGGWGGSHGSANPGEEKAEGTAYIPLFPQSPPIPAIFRAW